MYVSRYVKDMNKRFVKYQIQVHEPEFGSSTSAIVEVDNWDFERPIVSFEDTSDHSTNYLWDGWERLPRKNEPFEFYIKFLEKELNIKFKNEQYRTPYIGVSKL